MTKNDDSLFLNSIIDLCENLAFGRKADENALFNLTREGVAPENFTRLAEAFGMMLVKVETREFHRNELIADLQARNRELEDARRLLAEKNAHLTRNLQEEYQANRIIGQCDAMRQVVGLAMSLSNRPVNTLILGPTGAGKEIIAKAIHFNSVRCENPFIAVNCTAIPESLFESEMFGIEKGVATGVQARKGIIEEANGGTLFLDEVADMSLVNQAKLLRVLEEKELARVGSSRLMPVDIKVIAATHQDLFQAVRERRFREDLYYRLNVAEIRLPPLRERGEDVLLLARVFLDRHCANMGRPRLTLSSEAKELLMAYAWPGNVRELNNEMERASALTVGDVVTGADLSSRLLAGAGSAAPERGREQSDPSGNGFDPPSAAPPLSLQESERRLVREALRQTRGNKSRAAELLGITREGLRKKLLRLEQEK
ncbi:MAG: sigma-54 dependent transcriptional regulator [Desulfovibrio sp.]|jgi:transcriptional regulator with PAS, ATPase and Fis domain|nr:sigma-54 dependent transcriptional regulator [Desulfovibrio sp.]